jgi:hypothetical protein
MYLVLSVYFKISIIEIQFEKIICFAIYQFVLPERLFLKLLVEKVLHYSDFYHDCQKLYVIVSIHDTQMMSVYIMSNMGLISYTTDHISTLMNTIISIIDGSLVLKSLKHFYE